MWDDPPQTPENWCSGPCYGTESLGLYGKRVSLRRTVRGGLPKASKLEPTSGLVERGRHPSYAILKWEVTAVICREVPSSAAHLDPATI